MRAKGRVCQGYSRVCQGRGYSIKVRAKDLYRSNLNDSLTYDAPIQYMLEHSQFNSVPLYNSSSSQPLAAAIRQQVQVDDTLSPFSTHQ